MARSSDVRQPFYFGADEQRLFGCLHPPSAAGGRDAGVLVCAPPAQEGIRSHRSLLQLAVRLARAGFPVLRFDLSCCGDSAGDTVEARWERWLTDLAVASAELRRRARVGSIVVVGIRLGGALAALSSGPVEGCVLWDPVVNGRDFLRQLEADHRAMLRHSYVDDSRFVEPDDGIERMGFLWPGALVRDLEAIEVADAAPPARALIVESEAGSAGARLAETWRGAVGDRVEHRVVPSPQVWSEEPFKGLVPGELLDGVVSWIGASWR